MKKITKILLLLVLLLFPLSTYAYENDNVTLYFFHGDGCPHCALEREYLKELQEKYPKLKIERYEVWYDDENSELLSKVEKAFGTTRSGVPTNVIGNTIMVGFSDISASKLERAIDYYYNNEYEDVVAKIKEGTYQEEEKKEDEFKKEEEKTDEELSVDIPIFGKMNLKKFSLTASAALIGLIDGFNPCAMWVLLFLISILIGMKDRKRMWIIGLAFLLTSAIFYMLIILSWISIAVKITTVIWIRNIIATIAIIGAIINIRSFIKTKDTGCDVVDESKRKKIFTKIRKFTNEKSLLIALLGVMGLAISVNFVELACSAGLPLIFSELLALNNVGSTMKFIYTLVYIFFFLIDDLIVFLIAMFTMKVTGISTKYNKYSHLIGGIIMLIVGVLLILKPEWLMFNFK